MQLRSLSKGFGNQAIVQSSTVHFPNRAVVGLVGPNGIGKTTLLRMLAGEEAPDAGVVDTQGATVGYLRQVGVFEEEALRQTVMEWMLPSDTERQDIIARIEALGQELGGAAPDRHNALMAQLTHWQMQLELAEQSNVPAIDRILRGLGLSEPQIHGPVGALSGGFRMRLPLAQLLATTPGIMLLDEPTNHLDIDAMLWLENELQGYGGCVILTSHDRAFLDAVCTHVLTIDEKQLWFSPGDYAVFERFREERLELALKTQEQQLREREQLEQFVRRFGAKASKARQAQSRKKQLEKMEDVEVIEIPVFIPKFPKTESPPAPKIALTLEQLSGGYSRPLFANLDWNVLTGSKYALVGPNGVGKSTLLKTIVGLQPQLGGECRLAPRTQYNYYAQDAIDRLDTTRTVLETAQHWYADAPIGEIRSLLGAALFSGDAVFKSVSHLSGGEKARLVLALMLRQPANLLILDEPTNHLDVLSRQSLARHLRSYKGTVICVSHDRDFLNTFVSSVVDMHEDAVLQYPGTMREYEQRHKVAATVAAIAAIGGASETGDAGLDSPTSTQADAKAGKASSAGRESRPATPAMSAGELFKQRKALQSEYRKVSKVMETAEQTIASLQQTLADPAHASDHKKLLTLQAELNDTRVQLERHTERWFAVSEEAESLGIELEG